MTSAPYHVELDVDNHGSGGALGDALSSVSYFLVVKGDTSLLLRQVYMTDCSSLADLRR
jgi:hypothetical protein